ncbi:MAG: hypothetical protein COA71_04050 [SAR86 cluster bacterium]|uniref:Adhesin domain-containing protein n=1 Tax=SAR86 cluster bacterium TaxID=2030880 RepID=A0A2A5CH25_9GAMM|nr:MAG: hypothetical protein COA71_04050 [SAR86 cluster bacterium]
MRKIIVILITMSCLYGVNTYAADRVSRNHSFDLEDINEIEINNSVGSIELRLVEGDELRIEVEIEGEDRAFFRRRVDVDDVDVEIRTRGDKLILTIDNDDVKADWTIEMPVVSAIEINMGVGEIDVEIGASRLDIDLGIGKVDVTAPLATVAAVEISAGVGDTRIRGTDSVENSRVIVSSESEVMGEGDFSISAEVGVGEISIELD